METNKQNKTKKNLVFSKIQVLFLELENLSGLALFTAGQVAQRSEKLPSR